MTLEVPTHLTMKSWYALDQPGCQHFPECSAGTFCAFQDISGAAVQIGTVNSSDVTEPLAQDRYNVVNNSVMSQPAAELHGIPGINVGACMPRVLVSVRACVRGPVLVLARPALHR